jgi:hypothetical protein
MPKSATKCAISTTPIFTAILPKIHMWCYPPIYFSVFQADVIPEVSP